MLEARSPLEKAVRFEVGGVMLREEPISSLTLVAGTDKALKKALGKLPTRVGDVMEFDGSKLFRVGPQQIWVFGSAVAKADGIFVTPLSSSRTCILVEGPRAAELLSAAAAINFHFTSLNTGQFAMTGIHHTPVTIHCINPVSYHVYVLRTFALDIWDWLCDLALGLDSTHA